MPRSHTLPRAVAAALAITALAAPAALAQPAQDLRSPDTADAAAHKRTLQDLRSPDAKDAASPAPSPPVYWAYDYAAPDPKTAGTLASAQPSTPTADTGDGAPWAIFAIGLAGAALAGAGVAGKTRLGARRSGATA
jgi:hypothetical protein